MEMNFSFGGNFAKLIGEHLLLHFPYIRKVICIHAPQSDNVTAFFSERLMNDIFTGIPDISDATSQLQPLIMNNRNATWFTDNELPFSHERVRAQTGWQIPVFNELERNILLIRQSSEDGIDLLFMYFSPVISGVSQAAQHPGLSTSEKQIIGAIFSHFLSFWQEMVENDRLAFSTLSRKIREMNEAVISLKTHLGNEQNTSFHLFRTKADAMLESITGNHARNFRLSEAAIRRLMELSLSDENLHTVLSEAVILTETLYWGSKNGEILISDDHLPQRYHTVTAKSATEIREMGETRLTKTIRLLDRLEEASLKVLENQQNLTGKNVGAFCSTPISAPAISDALRNHRMKIEELFSIYPDQWYLLRKHFKPIRNILTGKYSDLKNTG